MSEPIIDAEYSEGGPPTRFEVKIPLRSLNGESSIGCLVFTWDNARTQVKLSIGALSCELDAGEMARVMQLVSMTAAAPAYDHVPAIMPGPYRRPPR